MPRHNAATRDAIRPVSPTIKGAASQMMMDSPAGSKSAQWRAPECPFTIEYAIAVLDDVRLAVVDAFFSMPRGGVEIGGILLGDYQDSRVSIVNSVPLECEH